MSQINLSTLRIIKIDNKTLTHPIYAEKHPSNIGDYDSDGISDLMVKLAEKHQSATVKWLGNRFIFNSSRYDFLRLQCFNLIQPKDTP